ncbi:MAG TPA: ATP synthase F1 subunit delta [Bacteroidales bacterium]|nr:ATP synthase F1 subunit delta [Bacteroidales bacterium]HSA44507.1 ATP synthase F1 subunit delta [Bacteroidales bacterium]
MKNTKVGSRYARAFFDLSVEKDFLEEAHADMQTIRQTIRSSRELRLMLQNPVISPVRKAAVLREIFGQHVSEGSLLFMRLLAMNRREMHLEAVTDEFGNLYLVHKNIRLARIRSAFPLNDALREKVIDMVKDRFHCEVILQEETDPGLIGGFVLQVDDYQFDTSMLTELNQLRKQFQENVYKKGF